MLDISNSMLRNSGVKVIYTDGGCYNNGCNKGIGSWAFVEYNPDIKIADVYCGFVSDSTNNRTEMMAVIEAIKHYEPRTSVNIISDSGYVVTGYNHPAYLDRWIQNNWRTSTNTPVQNQDLWESIIALSYWYGLKLNLIKGHYKDRNHTHAFWNSIVDRACTEIMQNHKGKDGIIKLQFDLHEKKFIGDVVNVLRR